jgi:cell pole-organizing protein PopZ
MSTANPQPSHPSLESEQRAHEPSMEEILASIRRIIADDDALPLVRRPALVTREPAATLVSTEPERRSDLPRQPAASSPALQVHLVAVPESSSPRAPGEADAAIAEQPQLSAGAARPESHQAGDEGYGAQGRMAEEYELRGPVRDEAFREEEHGASVTAREHRDNERTRLVSPATDASVASSFQSLATSMFLRDSDLIARTAREMLQPMLKAWLDDNLPVMVERLVRAEIERVARGGR